MRYFEDELDLSEDSSFLDVGTGNGHFLFELRDTYTGGRMLGVDYSEKSIELAVDIAKERGLDGDIDFVCADVVRGDPMKWAGELFDVVLDKGTFDAISLSDELLEDGRKLAEGYTETIAQIVKPGKWFIITSCNWTEDELKMKLGGVGGIIPTKCLIESWRTNRGHQDWNIMVVSSEYGLLLFLGGVVANGGAGTHLSHLAAKRDRRYPLCASGVLNKSSYLTMLLFIYDSLT